MTEDNSIFIGNKPFMNYVTGVVMQFTTKGAETVKIKARGKFISRAVDVAEVAAKRFLDETVFADAIVINSEEFQNREGRNVRVSTIEVVLVRKDGMEPRLAQPIKRMPMGDEAPAQEDSAPAMEMDHTMGAPMDQGVAASDAPQEPAHNEEEMTEDEQAMM